MMEGSATGDYEPASGMTPYETLSLVHHGVHAVLSETRLMQSNEQYHANFASFQHAFDKSNVFWKTAVGKFTGYKFD